MSLRGPCGAKLHAEGRKRGLPPGALRGTATAKGPTRGLPPGALRGTTVARSPPPTVCYIVCSSIFVIVCCSVSGSRSEDRSLSDAPLARAQSARGAADVSGTMRRASGALTVCCTACTAAGRPKTGAGGDRSLSGAPPARAQSARGSADVSGTMRRASGALTACCTACTAAPTPKRVPWVVVAGIKGLRAEPLRPISDLFE